MKFIKFKSLILTAFVCLLPIFFGIALWNKLPESVPVHFDIYNTPDNFASKEVAVFLLPLVMATLQIFCCITSDWNVYKYKNQKKLETITKWITPVISIVLQTTILCYAIGYDIDIRKIATIMVGLVFIITGIYIPKLDYIKNQKLTNSNCTKNQKISPEQAKKINRFTGYTMLFMGILCLVTLFLPPNSMLIWLCLLIIVSVAITIYSVILTKK